jgi:hypothetical protein
MTAREVSLLDRSLVLVTTALLIDGDRPDVIRFRGMLFVPLEGRKDAYREATVADAGTE